MLAQAEKLRQQHAEADGQRAERQAFRQVHRRSGPAAISITDPGRRALVVDARMPNSARDAGSRAILSHMRALQRLGYAVAFVAAEDMTRGACDELEGQGIGCYGAPLYGSVEDVLRRQGDCFDVVYLHRADIAARYLALARAYAPRARILYSVADLHHVRLERQAAIEERPELIAASQRMLVTECTAAWSADAVITHSADEAELLRRLVPGANVHRVPWDVPVRAGSVPFADRHGVAFIGGYDHDPNRDAARWLVEAVMPLVWQTDPWMVCLLTGSAMPASIRGLAGPRVEAIGDVADLGSEVFDRVRLTVAPLRYGAGVKGKVLDSFAAGVPCVMSETAAEGLALPPALAALVGRDPAELAALICRLHATREDHDMAAAAGIELVRRDCGADAVTEALRTAIEGRRQVVRSAWA
jgi:glycosyltransferase involved in cell wall biosynthesis